ncbi:MAG: T9SS type A sorting domain-containing protein [Bacteroidota bacterium]|nr:T9SS type A sorting domain-containing protein [Bacteroidota bacterium]
MLNIYKMSKGKGGKMWKRILYAIIFLGAVNLFSAKSQNKITFVADYEDPNNWDIYIMDDDGNNRQRLTVDSSIDNHPTFYGNTLVWTSNRTGDFELYKADIANVEGTIQRLTYRDTIRGKPIPDRHPKFRGGSVILFDAKTKCIINGDTVQDRCSQPVRVEVDTIPLYEALWIIDADGNNLREIDPELADVSGIWPDYGEYRDSIDLGHPDFSLDMRHIVFGACVTGKSDDWETYMMDWDGESPSNLRRITRGPTIGPNQIQMSAGASLSVDGSWIFFNSTRTPNGNSMIFKVDTSARDIIPLRDAIPLTRYANAYIPTQYWPGWIIYVSDLEGTVPGLDMDVWKMREDGSDKVNLTGDIPGTDQTLELGDEVGWFCGLPRLLTPDTKIPKIMLIGSVQIISRMSEDPNYLPNWPDPERRALYPIFWDTLNAHMMERDPMYWTKILYRLKDTNSWDVEVVINTLMPPLNFESIDSVPPRTITDLTAKLDRIATGDTIELNWTAPGDDDTIGFATISEIRIMREEPFSNPHKSWLNADTAFTVLVTGPAGTPQQYDFVPTSADTYYFAIKTADEVGWWSEVSNYARVVVVPVDDKKFTTFICTPLGVAAHAKQKIAKTWTTKKPTTPNYANLVDKVVNKKFSYITVGLRGQLNPVKKVMCYLEPAKYGDVWKTLCDKGIKHTGAPRGFDLDNKYKLMMKKWKYMSPNKKDDHLVQELVVLNINLAASALGITPSGLGNLLYFDPDHPLDGITIDSIEAYADDKMTKWGGVSYDIYTMLDSVVGKINAAFSNGFDYDTAMWKAGTLYIPGTKSVFEVPYLKANPGAAPTIRHTEILDPEPTVYALAQNYPNPFNPTTTIQFELPEPAIVTLKVYNMLGQEVATLIDLEEMDEGEQEVEFTAERIASGVYFYRLVAQGVEDEETGELGQTFVSVKKMLLLK